MSRRTSINIAW